MLRTLFIAFMLAVLSASTVYGSPNPSAKSRKSTASATASHNSASTSHTKARYSANHAVARRAVHPAQAKQSSRSHQPNKTHLPANSHPARKSYSSPKPHEGTETETAPPRAVIEAASLRKARTVMPPPLRGSYESLVRQNEKSEADNLERIEDDDDLADRIARKMLVPVPVSAALTVNGNLPENRRYCRPWTATFLADLARAHMAAFHGRLEVSSAVRTVAYQKQLMRSNGNATAAEGDVASPHLTGATIDIAKLGLSRQEIGWMRAWLLPLEQAGKIDVEEEFRQSCFHITVYKSYAPPRPARKKALQATTGLRKTDVSGF
jgi:hypothetical protein